MRKTSIVCLTLLTTLPALADAWPPSAPSIYAGPPAYGPSYAMPTAPMVPRYGRGWGAVPFSPYDAPPVADGLSYPVPAGRAPSADAQWPGPSRPLGAAPRMPSLDIARGMDGDDYLIDIQARGIAPEQIRVRPTRRGLVIVYDRSVQTNRADDLPDGAGYRRSYSFSRGTTSRRIALPADADLSAMSREVSEGQIRLRIPRVSSALPRYQ